MDEQRSGLRPPLALVLASTLAEVFFAARYEAAAEYPLRERVWGLALAQLLILGLFVVCAALGARPGKFYALAAVGAVSLALMRVLKEGWRFYTLYADESSGLIVFGALAFLVSAWGLYWGPRAAFRMGPVVLWAVVLAGALVLASLAGQCRLTNLPALPLRPQGVLEATGALFFLLPEFLFWAEETVGRPRPAANGCRYLGVIWAVQSFLWMLISLVWSEGSGAFETARLGFLSVFRRFDILYMPVLLLLFFSRLVLYVLWLNRLWKTVWGAGRHAALWNSGLCVLGAAFLYSGGLQQILNRGEQVLLWLAVVLFLIPKKTGESKGA